MSLVYTALTGVVSTFLAAPFALSPRGRVRLAERYGSWSVAPGPVTWFHGASVGEVHGIIPLMKAWRERHSGVRILLTSVTTTGLDRGASVSDERALLPFDCAWFIRKALRGIEPDRFVFGETELWPELLSELALLNVPSVLVNGRISDRSFARYRLIRPLLSRAVRAVEVVCAGDAASAERFESLGVPASRIQVTGNAKYDHEASVQSDIERERLRAVIAPGSEKLFVLGSLHPGEEQWWLSALMSAGLREGRIRVVLAPRHKEKIPYFEGKLRQLGLPIGYRSRGESANPVLVLDTMGELEKVYSLAALAFIGGSIVDVGGHNPLEAAAYGVPIVMGSGTANVREIAERLTSAGALRIVHGARDVSECVQEIICGSGMWEKSAVSGTQICERGRGATERILSAIERVTKVRQ